jgi:NADPH:quinone reductase-like Zn-dependent oxidoreductase
MRQVWISKIGRPEVLEVREAPDPVAGDGEVRIRVKAAGINFADLMARVGLYPDAPKVPCVVGYEVSGIVDQVGAGVSCVRVGDRALAMPHFGGYSDTVVVPEAQALRMPETMSFEEGAGLPVVYLTAHHAMHYTGLLHEGSTVLIHSIAGGVGLAALELARAKRCIVFGTASPEKHAFVRERGCTYPLSTGEDYAAAIRAVVGERGLDLVLDPVGGPSWKRGYDLLGPCGRLVAFGFSAAAPSGTSRSVWRVLMQFLRISRYSPIDLMSDNKTVTGINMGHLFHRIEVLRPQLDALLGMYERGEIRPHVDCCFRFEEAAKAHQYLHDRKARGKVLLVP